MSIGGFITLVAVAITFAQERSQRRKTLELARYSFLMNECEGLKEAYIRIIDVLRLRDKYTECSLDAKSWKSLGNGIWPNSNDMVKIENAVQKSAVRGAFAASNVDESISKLRTALQGIATAAVARDLFEGREKLSAKIMPTIQKVGYLEFSLIPYVRGSNKNDECDLTAFSDTVKEAIQACGELLLDVCEFSKEVNIDP